MTVSRKKKTKEAQPVEVLPSSSPSPSASLIFISHDTRDAELAEAFSKLLSSVSAGVLKTFRSSDRKGSQGIEYGQEWYPELMRNLNLASDVVCLLTQRSLERPWILYEAGVAKGKLETQVVGIVLGIPLSRASTGPFALFQNCEDTEEALTKLVMQLVRRIPNAEPDREVIEMQVRVFRQRVSKILTHLDSDTQEEDASGEVSVAKLFEEIKLMFQDIPSRIEGSLDPYRRRKFRRFHPMMFEDFMHMSKGGDPIGLLIIFSSFRDELPWLYELGLEAYRAVKSRNRAKIEKAIENIHRAVKFVRHGPFMEDVMGDKEVYFVLRDLPHMLTDRFLPAATESSLKDKSVDDED